MDNKRTTILAFVAVAVMLAVCFIGFAVVGDEGLDATETGNIAKIGDTEYATLINAVKAVTDGQTIEILRNVTDGSGLGIFYANDHPLVYEQDSKSASTKVVMSLNTGQSFTIDFKGHTYCVSAPSVGSKGTENQAFHFEKGIGITLKNGTLTTAEGVETMRMVLNNYCDLTLDSMTLDGSHLYLKSDRNETYYTLSNNNGKANIQGSTSIIAKTGHYAFDVYNWPGEKGSNYPDGVQVVVDTTGTITGIIECGADSYTTTSNLKSTLTIKNGNLIGNIAVSSVYQQTEGSVKIEGGSFTDIVNAVKYATSGATITLADDVTVSKTIEISKDLTIDLNGHKITGDKRVFWIKEGALTLTGTGTVQAIDDTPTTSSVIRVGDANDSKNTAKIIVGQNVTISSNFCHVLGAFGKNERIEVEINGTLTSTGDDARAAFINNGSSQWKPTYVTIGQNAKLTSNKGYAIYFPGPGTLDVQGVIEGYGGIEFKSGTGTITVSGSAEIKATADSTEWEINDGGASTSGYAIALVENKNYAGSPTVTISQGADITGTIGILKDYDVSADKQAKLQFKGDVTVDYAIETIDSDRIVIDGTLTMTDSASFSIYTVDGVRIFKTVVIGKLGAVVLDKGATLVFSTNEARGFDAVLNGEATIVENFTLGSKDKLTVADDATLSIAKDKFLKLNEGAVISGRIAGQGSNAVVVDGLKAGSNGIKFTSGSLRIDGVIVKDGETAGVTVKIVSGTEVYISGQLKEGATMEVDAGTTVTIENETTFSSNGTITNNGSIVNAGTITNTGTLTNASTAVIVNSGSIENTSSIVNNGTVTNQASSTITNSGSIENKSSIVNAGSIVTSSGTVTNTGTLKMTDSSAVTGTVVNNGIVADERASGSTAVTIDTKSTGAVVTDTNADSYGKDVKVIVEDPETTPVSEGTITSTSDSYGFVSAVTTTGKLEIVLNDGYKTYTLTIPKDTVIAMGTVVSVEYLDFTSDTTKYEITTPGITEFSVKVPVQTGFKSAKVYCDGSTAGVSNVKYNSSQGYVTFDAGHNSTFTIVLSNVTPSSGTSDAIDEDTAFVGAIVVLVVAILALAVVIKRK